MYKGPRRRKMRLAGYNYSLPGEYFVTICTKWLKNYFGQVVSARVELSNIGAIAKQCWKEIPDHFPNTTLDEFVIMPNHIHGIVIIKEHPVWNWHANSIRRNNKIARRFQRLPIIIGSYKSAVTKYAHRLNKKTKFKWHKSYYDHIIQTDDALDNIREYILLNPENWENDSENTK